MCCTQRQLPILSGAMVSDFIFTQMTPSYIWLLCKLLLTSWCLQHLLNVLKEIDTWMQFNGLKLNGEKTELLVVIAQHRPRPEINHLQVSNECIQPSTSARNIGVIFDQDVSLEQHVVSVFKVCFFHLRNISKIRNCLSKSDIELFSVSLLLLKL